VLSTRAGRTVWGAVCGRPRVRRSRKLGIKSIDNVIDSSRLPIFRPSPAFSPNIPLSAQTLRLPRPAQNGGSTIAVVFRSRQNPAMELGWRVEVKGAGRHGVRKKD